MKKIMMTLTNGRACSRSTKRTSSFGARLIAALAAVLCYAMNTIVFTACTSDNDDNPVTPPEPEQLAEYTILYYANGGANADKHLLPIMSDFYKADPDAYKTVNVVVQYKFSTAENMKAQDVYDNNTCQMFGSKTSRWVVDPSKSFQEQVYSRSNIYGADNADYSSPDSLTNFINWAAKAYPAKKYMLIVNDHGGGYRPDDDLPETTPATTRGLMYDDGYNNNHFTVKSFHRAVAAANVRFETIFMLACMMNNLEYQFELQDLCDYVIASTYSMPAWGGALYDLPEVLSQPNVDIERALDAYCKADVTSWDILYSTEGGYPEDYPFYSDLTITRTANIAHLGKVLREFTDRLCDTYVNGTEAQQQAIDSCTARAIKVQLNRPNYDAVKYVKSIVTALPEVYDEAFYNQMKLAFNNCIVAQYYSKYLTTHNYMVDYSVLLGFQGAYSIAFWKTDEQTGAQTPYAMNVYADDGEIQGFYLYPTDDPLYYRMEAISGSSSWGSTLADTYEQLAFDRAVGWSRWLRLNRQWPNLFCPNELHFELPMPEEEGPQN